MILTPPNDEAPELLYMEGFQSSAHPGGKYNTTKERPQQQQHFTAASV